MKTKEYLIKNLLDITKKITAAKSHFLVDSASNSDLNNPAFIEKI